MVKRTCIWVGALVFVCCLAGWSLAADKVLKMSTTTSTESSGLLDLLLPEFKKDTGIDVKVIAKGTGAAIRDGQDGNVDIIFVHARDREEKFVADGFGTRRYAVMHNDFVILGPEGDPAKIKGMSDAGQALNRIAGAGATFVSRGDDSGTHTKEQSLWQQSGVKLDTQQQTIVANGKKKDISYILPADSKDWYMSIGQGMGKALIFTEEKQGYTMSDRGTFIKYKYGKEPALDLEVLCEGGDALLNPYGIIPVNPARHGHVANDLAMQFVEWIISARGQGLINDYRVEGKQLFFADVL